MVSLAPSCLFGPPAHTCKCFKSPHQGSCRLLLLSLAQSVWNWEINQTWINYCCKFKNLFWQQLMNWFFHKISCCGNGESFDPSVRELCKSGKHPQAVGLWWCSSVLSPSPMPVAQASPLPSLGREMFFCLWRAKTFP